MNGTPVFTAVFVAANVTPTSLTCVGPNREKRAATTFLSNLSPRFIIKGTKSTRRIGAQVVDFCPPFDFGFAFVSCGLLLRLRLQLLLVRGETGMTVPSFRGQSSCLCYPPLRILSSFLGGWYFLFPREQPALSVLSSDTFFSRDIFFLFLNEVVSCLRAQRWE